MKQKTKITSLLITLIFLSQMAMPAYAQVIFESEYLLENAGSTWVIDAQDDVTGDVTLQFGNTLNKTINYDTANSWFEFNDNISLGQNEIKNVVIDNLAGAPGSPVAGQIYHNTTDSNTYVYSGSGWEDITAVSSTSTKVVTVGTGLDYSSIAAAATYLNGLSGGIMLLSAQTHSITTAVNLTNITLIGKDPTKTTIQVSGSGQMDSFDTRFVYLTLDINAMTANMAVDVQTGSSSLQFEWVDFNIQDTGDSLIDSTAGAPPTSSITFANCNETGGSGTILKTIATGNLNAASEIFVSSSSGNSLLQLDDWDVTIEGSGNVYTSGLITTIPDNTIFVYPGMHLQGAVDSLTSGGSITILPGTHSISQPLVISNNNIEISGYGDASIIAAGGFSGGTDTTAAIQLGAADGTAPVDGVVLRNFKLTVSHGLGQSDIHGIRAAGGADNQVNNVTVQKTLGQSGSGATARVGIQLIDGTAEKLVRPVIANSRIQGDSVNDYYFTDGIHISSDGSITGVWGNGQGVENALLDGNLIDYVGETGVVFVGVDTSSLFNNRSIRMGAAGGGAYGIFMGNANKVNMNANVFSGSLSVNGIAVGIESFDTGGLKETKDSIFNNNIIDGNGNGGVGFGTGFQIGSASNTGVHRNSFQSNTIYGASNAVTTAIVVRGNADDNTYSNNDIAGNGNPWDTGVNLQSATQERNLIGGNRFTATTALISDAGTATRIGVSHHRSTSNPTVNDDNDDGYGVGTIWINTTANTSYILVNSSVGAAVWNQIDAAGGNPSFETVYTNDADKILTTSNGAFTINTGTNTFSVTGAASINNNNNVITSINTGTSTGSVNIGGGSNTLTINTTSWSISAAGIASGLTGITSTGSVNFSGASRLALRQGAANPATCTKGDIFFNLTDTYTYTCTATNTWTALGKRVPDMNNFIDTTADNVVSNNNTTNYWDGTTPFITPTSATSEVLMMMTVSYDPGTSADASVVVRVERNIGSAPTCGSSTKVGDETGFMSSDTDTDGASIIYVDSPATANTVYYTLCSSSDGTDSIGQIMEIQFTLYEINDAADLAEVYATNDRALTSGDVVSFDPNLKAGVKKSTVPYDQKILGVVSTQPAKTIGGSGGEGVNAVPIALTGRVPVKISTENGPIEQGDLLTSSSTPGVAMKATEPGYIIGRAFDSYSGKGIGLILMFVGNHYADPRPTYKMVE